MASGSSGRTATGSKGFDFNSDDVLCSYDDFANQENGKHVDHVSGKDFRESRMGRPTLVPAYTQQDESLGQEVISTVEKTMKKYADNLLRFLEGISARLSQLELYCYNLEKSIGDMRTDLNRENNEADSKLRSLEKHLQEVHRSIQILRDKQELADTQKELTKLQLVHKDSQHNEEGVSASSSDLKRVDNPSEMQNQQLALALPNQVNPSTTLQARSMEYQSMPPSSQTPPQTVHVQTQPHTYYPQQNQLQLPPTQTHNHRQDQFMQADSQYQRPQMQVSQSPPQPLQSNVIQPQQVQSFPSYQQQQWSQQYPQQVVQQQQQQQQPQLQPLQAQLQPQPQLQLQLQPQTQTQPQPQPQPQPQLQPQPQTPQSQINPQTPPIYPSYPASQPVTETFSGSAAMQMPFPGIPQAGVGRPEAVGYGYGGTARMTVQQQPPPQHNMQQQSHSPSHSNTYGSSLSDTAYPGTSQPIQAPRQGYTAYDGDGGRVPRTLPPHFPHGGYPPSHASASPPPIRQSNSSQMLRGHPYGEMAEKATSMGYPRDYVLSVIRRMEESGQPVDFNSLLDRLNTHVPGGSQRPW